MSKSVAVANSNPPSNVAVPSFMKGDAGLGLVNITAQANGVLGVADDEAGSSTTG